MNKYSYDISPRADILDVAIVGAGFGGLYALHKLRSDGLKVRVVEAGPDIGGTWYWNCYPGARCDVESVQYCYSFDTELQRGWRWSERFAAQPEILSYIHYVADRLDLRRDITLNARVESLRFDKAKGLWTVVYGDGQTLAARFVILATGCLSSSNLPAIEGMDQFEGQILHTPNWPKEKVDFAGKTVGVIGTGSTGIQIAPAVAQQAQQLYVFQRTPSYSVPARNAALTEEIHAYWDENFTRLKRIARTESPAGVVTELAKMPASEASDAQKEAEYQKRWDHGGHGLNQAFSDLNVNLESNSTAANFVRRKICETVKDPEVAKKLLPSYPIFTKRICLDTNYFEMFNRDNTALVQLPASGIDRLTPDGVMVDGVVTKVDTIIFATGFDAITGAINRIHIENEEGDTLKEKWRDGPKSYFGLMSAGFPNLFTITGPGSPSVMSNVVVSIEEHVDWISACLAHMRDNDYTLIDVDQSAEDDWVAHVNEVAAGTLFHMAASWYLGANIPGKPRIFMPYAGGVGNYHRKLNEMVAQGYAGFSFSHEAASQPGRHATLSTRA
ncbi:flavin-containing monooxygenase [Devosia sp. A369]